MRNIFGVACLIVIVFMGSARSTSAEEKIGPLISVTPKEFLKLPEEYQVMYTAGYIDAASFISYGYSLPDHNELISCFRSMPLGDFTKEVVNWLKKNPKHKEGMASAVAHTDRKSVV